VVPMLTPDEVTLRRQRGHELRRQGNVAGRPEMRLAVLATFNVDLFPPFLIEAFARLEFHTEVWLGPFGQVPQAILDRESGLYQHEPTAILLLVSAEDLLAPLYVPDGGGVGASDLVADRLAELENLIKRLLDRLPTVTVYVAPIGTDQVPLTHVLAPLALERGQASVEEFLAGVRNLDRLSSRVVIVDWDWHARSAGYASFRDERLWYIGRMRLAPAGLAELAELTAEHVAAVLGLGRKVIAVDLDDTLWGGILGETGLGGLSLGGDGVGLAYQDFQRELLKLRDAGIVLTLCSKNNRDEVLDVFERHLGMVLRFGDFAAERVLWEDKAESVRQLAQELNLGLDSFVFLDDNPVERSWVSQALPEVLVPDLPEDPVERPAFLRAAPWFRRIRLTDADKQRADSYIAEGARRRGLHDAPSFEEFLASLEQEVTIELVSEGTLARAAQLIQRTNQFNLTTRRYGAGELAHMLSEQNVEAFTLSLRDRFGDSGITGIAILRYAEGDAEIDSLLLSCRVLGRRVEDVFVGFLAQRAREKRARRLIGRYVPNQRNMQVESFYPSRGFDPIGDRVYALPLDSAAAEELHPVSVKLVVNA
jgi:FkbH-like protein